ncbi:hypothetical protein DFP72DRAFT_802359 [Ephemerocybe angulata]|uniref:ACB domain-containing protein n=1 Tax=Ephemerocybe angulata TaxID=980116 RepID=A0A8H6IC75_9AGAR|nr:hypothetical protein DFP72DRAFT_802359 [Tulosesus angulatus]
MASHELIDAQFDRAVQIVQGLPKTGPIQTDYEEKLEILYKQATVGNVKSPRPGIFDMLGRAKWDAWAKHTDLDSYEAKWLYVEALLKVLRKYSDRTVAKDLVKELESYGGDPSNLVMSGSFARSGDSDSSGSTASEDAEEDDNQYDTSHSIPRRHDDEGTGSEAEETEDDEARELPPPRNAGHYENRPQSSMSSNRYRTPLAGSLLVSPPPDDRLPSTQPLPKFDTPSAFAPPTPTGYPNPLTNYSLNYHDTLRGNTTSPHIARTPSIGHHPSQYGHDRPISRPTLEYAIENVQSHLAALTERIESLEKRMTSRNHSPRGGNSPRWFANRASLVDDSNQPQLYINDLGLWSTVLKPLSRGANQLRDWAVFFARDENRSPAKIIVRRLVLDISFMVCVVAIIGAIWRKSGVRRKEVKAALVILWRALIGTSSRHHRAMSDKAI